MQPAPQALISDSNPHCDLNTEDSKLDTLQDHLSGNDAGAYQVLDQGMQQLKRCHIRPTNVYQGFPSDANCNLDYGHSH